MNKDAKRTIPPSETWNCPYCNKTHDRVVASPRQPSARPPSERREPDWWIVETGGVPVRVVSSKGNAEKWASRDRLKFPGEKNILVVPAYRSTEEK